MTKEQVIMYRNDIEALDITVPNEDGTTTILKTPIHIFCGTTIGQYIDWRDGSFIWDDDNELCTVFTYNSNPHMNLTPAISPGTRPVAPVYVGYVDYDAIIVMRSVLIEETFDLIVDKLELNEEEKKEMYHKFFVETDQAYIIERAKKIGYSTQHSKEFMKDKGYDDSASYLKTVHPHIL